MDRVTEDKQLYVSERRRKRKRRRSRRDEGALPKKAKRPLSNLCNPVEKREEENKRGAKGQEE